MQATGRPPSVLVHPLPIGALALLVINDHLLKAAWPGLVTGKLSDFAGLIVAPLLLTELLLLLRVPSGKALVIGVLVVGAAFALIKTLAPASALYVAFSSGLLLPFGRAAANARDPTDLVALVVLPPLYLWARARLRWPKLNNAPTVRDS